MSKYNKDTVKRICDALINLQGRVRAAKAGGISYETFTQWIKNKPEFSELIKKAESETLEKGKGLAIMTIFKAMNNGTWQAAAWWLERKFPSEFRNVQEQQVTYDIEQAREKLAKIIDAKFGEAA